MEIEDKSMDVDPKLELQSNQETRERDSDLY